MRERDIKKILSLGVFDGAQVEAMLKSVFRCLLECIQEKDTRGAKRMFDILASCARLEQAEGKTFRFHHVLEGDVRFVTAEQSELLAIAAELGIEDVPGLTSAEGSSGGKVVDGSVVDSGRKADGNGNGHPFGS